MLSALNLKPAFLLSLAVASIALARRSCDSENGLCPDTQEDKMSPKDFVTVKLQEGPVVIFSKTYCPFCTKTKELFKSLGVKIVVIELDERDDGSEIQDYLNQLTGGRSVRF